LQKTIILKLVISPASLVVISEVYRFSKAIKLKNLKLLKEMKTGGGFSFIDNCDMTKLHRFILNNEH